MKSTEERTINEIYKDLIDLVGIENLKDIHFVLLENGRQAIAGKMRISPELALILLERKVRDRALKKPTFEEYKASMHEGSWDPDVSPILLDANLMRLDGKHRCSAIAETGLTQWMRFEAGVPRSRMEYVDRLGVRGQDDIANIVGSESGIPLTGLAESHFAVGRFLLDWLSEYSSEKSRRIFTGLYSEGIRFAMRSSGEHYIVPIKSVITRAAYNVEYEDLPRLQHAIDVYRNAALSDGEPDSAMVTLRRFIDRMASNTTLNKATWIKIYDAADNLLPDFIRKRRRTVVSPPRGFVEQFPLPLEDEVRDILKESIEPEEGEDYESLVVRQRNFKTRRERRLTELMEKIQQEFPRR